MSLECIYCLGDHLSSNCPSQYQKRMVDALEKIVTLLEKQKPPAKPRQVRRKPLAEPKPIGRPRKAVTA